MEEEGSAKRGKGTSNSKWRIGRFRRVFSCTQVPVSPRKGSASPTTPSNQSEVSFCRICHEGQSKGELVSPCNCSGSLGQVHVRCLELWLSQSNTDVCEICKYHFVTHRTLRGFSEWMQDPANRADLRNLIGDLACLALLLPLSALSSYLCSLGAYHYMPTQKLEAAGLIALSSSLLFVFLVWCVITTRYHWKQWKSWQRLHQQVRLVLMTPIVVQDPGGPGDTREGQPHPSPIQDSLGGIVVTIL